uniref:DNA polymerase III PolC-type n=1 Tax=uncultured bacterium contig00017 TaxID=1181508 RepID=A0A806KFS1_9BACT|nr:DNA polymerase III alpha subunit [uncultured bacterium contig00017]
MAQYLTEVFPTLQLEESLDELLSTVVVAKVARTSKGDAIRIHVLDDGRLEQPLLNKTELEIQRQLFPGQPVTVKIVVEENVEQSHRGAESSEDSEAIKTDAPEPNDVEPSYSDGYEDLAAAVAERYEQAANAPKPKQAAPGWQGKYPRKTPRKRSSNPDVLYGRDFDDDPITPLKDIVGELGVVLVRGQIATLDRRSISNDKTILSFCLTDFDDSIMVKIFVDNEWLAETIASLEKGAFVKVKGTVQTDRYDGELVIGTIVGIKKADDFRAVRHDEAERKRIELHCHTKMSAMDGVSEAKALIERAFIWGHSAIAITDHGVVQAFPDAYKVWQGLSKKNPDFKIIYGLEGYLIEEESDNKTHRYHIIILAANETGRKNLYKLVSESHLNYYKNERARIPKSLLEKHREGLILGSACEAGELYRALLHEKTKEEIADIVAFYDYLEIQPVGNNQYMVASEKWPSIKSLDDIRAINRRIVALGEEFGKPVVATCDVHFLDPADELYRRIIMAGKGYADADDQAPLYLRTTEEMLAEFAYLGAEKAYEVVVENTNRIAGMVEQIAPLRPDRCPPVIADSDKDLKEMCYNRAHEIYGQHLPKTVESRLQRELDAIIGNGFAVMYIAAQKLIAKSLADGYPVGSRGSVGSSFAATMAGITEVNPLPPHYYCSQCTYSDFDSDALKDHGARVGYDLPERLCPHCETVLERDGFDIPFATFLGFDGDKEPDIDLNFSGEYQSKAHDYTEVIFGAGQAFRAGTISTLADKTAYGYVKKYYESKDEVKRKCEIDRIVTGCTGIRKSTGQHPGGIIILPLGEDINSFTPIQRPGKDADSDTITTHFDFHSIDHNLLKLDLLGHRDPTTMKMLADLTGVDPLTIPIQEERVMSLFRGTEALGITPEQIDGYRLGVLGVPEFGTDNTGKILEDAKPQSFYDLLCVSGLSHGTNVWSGNAQDLIKDGTATLSSVISIRDDIMMYLTSKGVDSLLAFHIMESVRKGKGLTKEWVAAMQEAAVPQWYIESCQKIEYMFPKAHAAAYVMMGWRIAYYKVYHPLAFYATFFSVRASAFDYESMCQGPEALERAIADCKRKKEQQKLTAKEESALRDMRIVQEMYARGFAFAPLDIYTAKAHDFQIVEGRIMPALSSIEGLNEKANGIVDAAKQGPFLSRDDFRERTSVSKTVIELMERLGLFGEMPESNQLSLFDLL